MSHRNARLTFYGRCLLVERVNAGQAVAHVAKAMGVSRQCAHRWVKRHEQDGEEGLHDRSSRPHCSPNQTGVPPDFRTPIVRRAEACFGRSPDAPSASTRVPSSCG